MSAIPGSLYAAPGSRVRRFAEALAWLWRLGPVREEPGAHVVAFGWQDEVVEMRRLLGAGDVAAAVVFTGRPGPRVGLTPGRKRRMGTASFGDQGTLAGEFYALDWDGEPAVESDFGVHAVRDGGCLYVGSDPETRWATLDNAWLLAGLADFLTDVLDRPLAMLPPIGWVRYDDVPGSAYHLLSGKDKPDREMRRRVEKVVKSFARAGACLNVAIPSRALVDGQERTVDQVWPEATRALQDGVGAGRVEPVYHGYLHLDTAAWAEGRMSPREFEDTAREEAERRLEGTIAWFEAQFGEGRRTFIAPTWAYSRGLLEALEQRRIPTWLSPEPGPIVAGNTVRETLYSTLEGLAGLDYRPFGALAGLGFPPTVVIHGGLFDARLEGLRDQRQLVATARLAARRDLFRVAATEGVRWLGAADLVARLRAHDQVRVDSTGVSGPPGTEIVLRDSGGARTTVLGPSG